MENEFCYTAARPLQLTSDPHSCSGLLKHHTLPHRAPITDEGRNICNTLCDLQHV